MFIWESEKALKEFRECSLRSAKESVKCYKRVVDHAKESVKELEERVKVNPSEYNKERLNSDKRILKMHRKELKRRKENLASVQERCGQRDEKKRAVPVLTVIKGGKV